MKSLKYIISITYGFLVLSLASPSYAQQEGELAHGAIEVTWGDFNKFRDVRAAAEPRGAFHKRVKQSFEKFFDESAKEVPQGQVLLLEIRDIDLAGDVLPAGTNEVRIMKDLYFPRIEFAYKLTGADGKVIKEGEAKLKDMNYLYHEKDWKRYRQGFYYEKHMITEWLQDNL